MILDFTEQSAMHAEQIGDKEQQFLKGKGTRLCLDGSPVSHCTASVLEVPVDPGDRDL